MADGDTVKMKLTFWRDDKQPGDLVDVPADEVHRWKGFAVQVDEPEPTPETTTPTTVADGKPAETAKVDEWRAYAIKRGYDESKANKATKQELIDWVQQVDSKTTVA
ncbi:hypothetical protein JL475_00525 [Streptomyces sp. M2CJ-2]|uniref:hypothetical protein n=1 Tax=Streptomyces sp. M2CJ-2 TaxID=2803948 RepID=UPI0019210F74|nr:hypothetical protein [Streptomyces sp. M2CJ-2]MBL3664531.1 hypothetical protein [Streptomyces sp. M2CJ-2]